MLQVRLVLLATAALLALPLVVAHGHGEGSATAEIDTKNAIQAEALDSDRPGSYWRLFEHAGLMYMHIALEVLAWFFVLPVGKY